MSEIAIVIIGAVVSSRRCYFICRHISTATGMEEDKNQNYIPDWIEKRFPKIFKSGKDLE